MDSDWRPVLKDDTTAYLYHLLSARKNENPIAQAIGFSYMPEDSYEAKDELVYLEDILFKLEKKALKDYYGLDHHTLLVMRWISAHRNDNPNPPSAD